MQCALIMAGGVGSRFWPYSTPSKPKQFLKLINDKTMLQLTYERINRLIAKENIFIVTNREYKDIVKEQIKDIEDVNIICEPVGRNTAPCILLSCLYIKNLMGEANIACISSDSYIVKDDVFLNNIKDAFQYVEKNSNAIVTIGITPTRPETGYGYIEYKKSSDKINKVIKFIEKPNLENAIKYFVSHQYLWNAGMFIFNNLKMLEELKANIPDDYNKLIDLPKITDKKYEKFLNDNYEKCNKISIDYAVMEKSTNVYTIPSDIGWDDVGTWKSLERYIEKDSDDNVIKGNVVTLNSHDNIVYGDNKRIVLLNTNNIFCIDSKDYIIIGQKEDIDEVHKLKDILK